jgi:hypothetical protein
VPRENSWQRTVANPNATRMLNSTNSLPRCLWHAALLLSLLDVASCSRKASEESRAASPADLVGAWRAKLQFSSGAFASIKNLEFMYAFNAGGTMTESSNYDGAPPVPPAYGVWRAIGPLQFEAKYAFYITQLPKRFEDITSGGGWMPNGHGVFTERITLGADGQSFDSSITYQAFDSLGAPATGGGEAKGHGVRIAF